MAESIEDQDGYLIPGASLSTELLNRIQDSGHNSSKTDFNFVNGDESSLLNLNSIQTQNGVKNDRQSSDDFNGLFPRCLKDNEPEIIKSSLKTHQAPDSSAWSVETVTVKSGKHRTNRASVTNKDRTKGMELPDSVASIHNLIANRIISSHYRQTQPSRHTLSISCSNSTPGRRPTGPYRLKPIVNHNLQNKASTGCADSATSSSLKGHNVNKQMANVSEGISSTGSPALHDRWEGGKNALGLKQTTELTCVSRDAEAAHDIMDKKIMMKRQCMYFPVDDYVTLSPIPPTSDQKTKISNKMTSPVNDEVFEKQLSPMTISSGYESDYSPPWSSDMDKVFAKMVASACFNNDDSHTDYFSQSETYPRSADVQDKCSVNPPQGSAPGSLDQLTNLNKNIRDKLIDEYDSSCINEEKIVLAHEACRNDVHTVRECSPSKICLDKYFLNHGSTSSATEMPKRSSLGSRSTVSLDNVDPLLSAKFVNSGNGPRRSKRYRYDVNRESLCKLNVESASNSDSDKPLGDFEMQTTCSNVTSPRITPIDFFGLFKKSPPLNQSQSHCDQTVSNNSIKQIEKTCELKSEQVKTNVSHGVMNNVGDLCIDNMRQLKQNSNNLGCAKPPGGRLDNSDYEHIYDVIPGDENVLSPSKYPSMATQLVRNKWSTLDDVRRPRNIYNENPPALPARSYLQDKGNNSLNSKPTTRYVCSSVDDLYARVSKREDKTDRIYASPWKDRSQLFDISNKENVLCSLRPRYDDDYEYLSSETYCRIGSSMEEKVTNWSSGDVLNFIDGIQQPEPKSRDNIYGLLGNRQIRAKLSESLEIEHKLVNMGLLKNSWSCEKNVDIEEQPPKIPPRAPLNNPRPIYV